MLFIIKLPELLIDYSKILPNAVLISILLLLLLINNYYNKKWCCPPAYRCFPATIPHTMG